MNCDQALEAISAALDGELSPGERAALSKHLLSCQTCRELAEDLRALTDILEDSDQAPPPELAPSIRRAVAGKKTRSVSGLRPYWRTAAAMLALCVCLGGAGYGLLLQGRTDGAELNLASGGAAPANTDPGQAAPEARNEDAITYAYSSPGGEADGSSPVADSGDVEPEAPTGLQKAPDPSPETDRSPSAALPAEAAPAPMGSFVPLTQDAAQAVALDYLCALTEDADWVLTYDGLSENECYYFFLIEAPEDSGKSASVTRLAVALEDGTVLDEQDSGFELAVNQ